MTDEIASPTSDSTPFTQYDNQLRPCGEFALRACKALHEHRLDDAATNIKAISADSLSEQAWLHLLTGRLMVAEKTFSKAKPELLQAAGLAFAAAAGAPPPSELHRVAASALNLVGWIYRRQDQPAFATSVHDTALQLRNEHGTIGEQWETMIELGLDAELARDWDQAQLWYSNAIEVANRLATPHDQHLASNYDHLARVFLARQATHEAVDAARFARDHWRAHDIRLASASRADLALGHALLMHAEFHLTSDPQAVHTIIDECVELLEKARDALAAFGPRHASEVDRCRQHLDVANKMRDATC